ncbi:MAG: enoyl-CoA hydratase-related protein [Rubrivivax sp.]
MGAARAAVEPMGAAPGSLATETQSQLVRAERTGEVLVLTLQRAPVNAINDELLAQLEAVLDAVEADDTLAVLHLRSACKVFSAGADLALIRRAWPPRRAARRCSAPCGACSACSRASRRWSA